MLATHAPLRVAVTAYGRDATATDTPAHMTAPAALRLIAFCPAAESVARILTHLGAPAESPRIAPAR